MEFEQLFTDKKMGNHMKWVTIVGLTLSFSSTIFFFSCYMSKLEELNSKTWMVDQSTGDILKASFGKLTRSEQMVIEYKNHVQMWYGTMFTYDKRSYEHSLLKASHLAGNCFKDIKEELESEYILNKMRESNMRIYCEIDSVIIENVNGQYKGRSYAKQHFENSEGRTTRFLNATFLLIDQKIRTVENPHAVIIEDWHEFDTEIIERKSFD